MATVPQRKPPDSPPRDAPVLDRVRYGRLIRAARDIQGITAEQLARCLVAWGVPGITARKVYSWERGEVLPHVDAALALRAVLDPPGGVEFFRTAFAPRLWAELFGNGRSS